MKIKFKPRVIESAKFFAVLTSGALVGVGTYAVVDYTSSDAPVQDVSVMQHEPEQTQWIPLDNDALFEDLEERCAYDFGYASDDYVDCTSWVMNLTCQFEPLPEDHANYGAMDQRCSWEQGL